MTLDEQNAIFQRWIRSHLGLMVKVVRSFADGAADQDDLLQDILVNLWSSIHNFRGAAKETTWIYRVSIQTAMVWRRGERRREKHRSSYVQEVLARQRLGTNSDGDDRELIEQLYAAIRQLPKVDASIALLHLEGLAYREISEALGLSENYVGVKLSRIRSWLIEQLGGSSN
ncbi:MAG: sigma-70 family RNA polymerase sigma factor [Planctomycetaceae bacterium]|nr:sigma-70 family RNA polymerase sigma factor [Planctomycetaceae bacterium]